MKVAVFDTHRYDQEALEAANVDHVHEVVFFEPRLNSSTAVLARGFRAVCSYEEEEAIFVQDLSERGLQDDVLARLLTFPNVLITPHQGFLTREALTNIAATTLSNITLVEREEPLPIERVVTAHVTRDVER